MRPLRDKRLELLVSSPHANLHRHIDERRTADCLNTCSSSSFLVALFQYPAVIHPGVKERVARRSVSNRWSPWR